MNKNGITTILMVAVLGISALSVTLGTVYVRQSIEKRGQMLAQGRKLSLQNSVYSLVSGLSRGGYLQAKFTDRPSSSPAGAISPKLTPRPEILANNVGEPTGLACIPITAAGETNFHRASYWELNRSSDGVSNLTMQICPNGSRKWDGSCGSTLTTRVEFLSLMGDGSDKVWETVSARIHLEVPSLPAESTLAKIRLPRRCGPPSVTPPAPKQTCAIFQGRRGSQFGAYKEHPFDYWQWKVFIPAPNLATALKKPGCGPKSATGRSCSLPPTEWVENVVPTPTLSGQFQPCNRMIEPVSVCSGGYSSTPQSYTHTDGYDYALLNAPQAHSGTTFRAGTVCGTAECPCYLLVTHSPLVISIDNEPVKFTGGNEGVSFDFGEANPAATSWIANPKSSQFLAWDRNGNRKIDSIQELFGDPTEGPDGRSEANGFLALAKYDSNADGVIDRKDPIFSQLVLWSDRDGDAVSSPRELRTLSQSQVRKIELHYTEQMVFNDQWGNHSKQDSRVEMDDGSFRNIYDVYFVPAMPAQKAKTVASKH